MFVRITKTNRIGLKHVEPGDVVQVEDSMAKNMIRTGHAEALAGPIEENMGESRGWMLEKT